MPMVAFERDAIMAALIDTGGPWDPAAVYLGVFETITDLGVDTVLTDLVRPTGDMHDAQPVTTWTDYHVKSDGAAMVDSPVRMFRPADYTEQSTLLGWFVADDDVSGNLLAFGYFDSPVILLDETEAVGIVLHAIVSPVTVRWFEATVFNG